LSDVANYVGMKFTKKRETHSEAWSEDKFIIWEGVTHKEKSLQGGKGGCVVFFYKKLLLTIAVLLGLIFCLGGSAAANSWNVADDFSATTNPNPPWTYGYEKAGGGGLNLFQYTNTDGDIHGWTIEHPVSGTPAFWKNTGTSQLYFVPGGMVALHPGFDSTTALAVARWTSPITETVTVEGSFGAGDSGAMSYYIVYNNNFSSPLYKWENETTTKPFKFIQTVSPGDTIDFIVGPQTDGYYSYGTTPIAATITSTVVPLPGAVWLMSSGLLGLAGLGRRRSRKS